jgi:endonuclease-3
MQEFLLFFQEQCSGDLRLLRKALLAQFGPEPFRARGTIDEQLTGSVLSGRTKDKVSYLAFVRLATHFHGDWNLLGQASEAEILPLISNVTFAPVKAHWLKLLWHKNSAENGIASFAYLAQWPVEKALGELEKNTGVGRKCSAATLNFSTARRPVFVIDTHVLRFLRRYGFVSPWASTEQAYAVMMQIAAGLTGDALFELHWHMKRLGQQFCTHDEVACGCCPASQNCLKRLERGVRLVLRPKPPEAWNGF